MAKKRTAGKANATPDETPVKFTLSLSRELARRFGVHCEMTGSTYSELFAQLVRDGCRKFVVHTRGDSPTDPAEGATE